MDTSEISDSGEESINLNQDPNFPNKNKYDEKNMLAENATNSHPLMLSPTPPMSPDFPDLIPKQAKMMYFTPNAHSSLAEDQEASVNQYQVTACDQALPEVPAHKQSMEINPNDPSDNENDKSVYEAHLSSNLQKVSLTMNEKEGNLNFLAHNKRSNKLRKIKVVDTQPSEDSDVSSLDTNSDSLKSEDVFNEEIEDSLEKLGDATSPEPMVPLSAAEERCHARYWQRMVLPTGEQRTIDMRVIEPYKRLLSHGGYLRPGGHTAIMLFSACYLPDKSRVDYDYVMDNLFLYLLWTLDRLVTEDYVLVYLPGGSNQLPSFGWLKKCYYMVGRKLRKNLSHLYLVHPTLWIKTMLFMARPFIRWLSNMDKSLVRALSTCDTLRYALVWAGTTAVVSPSIYCVLRHPKTPALYYRLSSKFYRKISIVNSLRELMGRVPIEVAALPEKVKAYDALHAT